eukprot:gnl/Dysnectes_brevis/4289_a5691_783.p1 GENE.gnl/Dysnectes_brevis/4289_a5691_783~~gnl/Dysnectes_brevis/4289_a5691_783.p1  ORF type:complete len:404 (-),score=25.47 gnl/Dysnectes_brevis/4289_a5691_783:156-1367(-)
MMNRPIINQQTIKNVSIEETPKEDIPKQPPSPLELVESFYSPTPSSLHTSTSTWTLPDINTLINSVLLYSDLSLVHKHTTFTHPHTLVDITHQWFHLVHSKDYAIAVGKQINECIDPSFAKRQGWIPSQTAVMITLATDDKFTKAEYRGIETVKDYLPPAYRDSESIFHALRMFIDEHGYSERYDGDPPPSQSTTVSKKSPQRHVWRPKRIEKWLEIERRRFKLQSEPKQVRHAVSVRSHPADAIGPSTSFKRLQYLVELEKELEEASGSVPNPCYGVLRGLKYTFYITKPTVTFGRKDCDVTMVWAPGCSHRQAVFTWSTDRGVWMLANVGGEGVGRSGGAKTNPLALQRDEDLWRACDGFVEVEGVELKSLQRVLLPAQCRIRLGPLLFHWEQTLTTPKEQ